MQELTPPDPSKLALALTNLGVTYVQAERHSDALPPLREAYTIRHRLDDMPGLAEVAVNLEVRSAASAAINLTISYLKRRP